MQSSWLISWGVWSYNGNLFDYFQWTGIKADFEGVDRFDRALNYDFLKMSENWNIESLIILIRNPLYTGSRTHALTISYSLLSSWAIRRLSLVLLSFRLYLETSDRNVIYQWNCHHKISSLIPISTYKLFSNPVKLTIYHPLKIRSLFSNKSKEDNIQKRNYFVCGSRSPASITASKMK